MILRTDEGRQGDVTTKNGWIALFLPFAVLAALGVPLVMWCAACSDDTTAPDPTLVEIDLGALRGLEGHGYRVFRGIPYAAPPVGALRFRPPAPPSPWEGERDATAFSARCLQLPEGYPDDVVAESEDCLTLNVWTPWPLPAEPAPVLVFIHGGSFVSGSGSSPTYDGAELARRGLVVVTINYRLGPLGFLAAEQLAEEDPELPTAGNYGILDQQAALRWVRDSISAFGGDPSRVTVGGNSSGASSICVHLQSPLSRGLFERAWLSSSACRPWPSLEQRVASHAVVISRVGCADAEDLPACLRAVSAKELRDAADGVSFGEAVDNVVLLASGDAGLTSTSLADVPVLVGSARAEGVLFAVLIADTYFGGALGETQYTLLRSVLWPDHASEVETLYPLDTYGSPFAAFAEAYGDSLFICPSRHWARALADVGRDVWRYEFAFPIAGTRAPEPGAFHSGDLRYFFGGTPHGYFITDEPPTGAPSPLAGDEVALSEAMVAISSASSARVTPTAAWRPPGPASIGPKVGISCWTLRSKRPRTSGHCSATPGTEWRRGDRCSPPSREPVGGVVCGARANRRSTRSDEVSSRPPCRPQTFLREHRSRPRVV